MSNVDSRFIQYMQLHEKEVEKVCSAIAFSYHIEREDFTASVKVKLLIACRNGYYTPEKGKFVGYAVTTARNAAIDIWRCRRSIEVISLDDVQINASVCQPEKSSYNSLIERVTAYVCKQTEQNSRKKDYNILRMLYFQHFIEGKRYEEIAQEFDLPDGTVKSYIFRIKDIVNNRFGKEYREIM